LLALLEPPELGEGREKVHSKYFNVVLYIVIHHKCIALGPVVEVRKEVNGALLRLIAERHAHEGFLDIF